MKEFKTFRDLEFKRKFYKYNGSNVHKARITFDNGYGISVVHDDLLKRKYEIGVLHNDTLCYDTPITSDVIKHLTGKEVTKLMKQIQQL